MDHLSLGRGYVRGSAESVDHLDQAVYHLWKSGRLDYLPLALPARRSQRDLEEVLKIATRSGMRLHLTDYHLAMGNYEEAARLIEETGYHRRDAELAEVRREDAAEAASTARH